MNSSLVEHMRDAAVAAAWKRRAIELGFDLAGIAPAHPSQYRDYFRKWLDDGQAGSMDWLARRFEERTDPAVYLPGAKSVLCVAANYFRPSEEIAADRPAGRVARYARGQDYHDVIKPRLHALADWLRGIAPNAQTKAAVDTAPVMEKELAMRAGIGWMGKNTCIIHPSTGSWLFLGEVITTLDLPPDPPEVDHCGTCTRCLDACPTQAFSAAYQLDARRCISYLTIECRGELSPSQREAIGDWIYGCDICQEVCPFNRRAPAGPDPAWTPRIPPALDVEAVEDWSDADYRQNLGGSAMRRVKLPMLQRNAKTVRQNLDRPAP